MTVGRLLDEMAPWEWVSWCQYYQHVRQTRDGTKVIETDWGALTPEQIKGVFDGG